MYKLIHEVFGCEKPAGWSNQLSNNPGLEFFYAKRWNKFIKGSAVFGFDLIPKFAFGAGNIFLGGNTFQKSYSIEKYPVNGSFSVGIGLVFLKFSFSYSRGFDSLRFK